MIAVIAGSRNGKSFMNFKAKNAWLSVTLFFSQKIACRVNALFLFDPSFSF